MQGRDSITKYDPQVIHEFAERLYQRAAGLLIQYVGLAGLVGAAFGYIGGGISGAGNGIGALFGFGVFGAIGYAMATEKASALKLQAQTALCQARIEENTRTVASAAREAA